MQLQRCKVIELKVGDALPSECLLFKYGVNETRNGSFYYDERSAAMVKMAQEEHGVDLSFDYEHAALSPVPVKAVAAAWFDLEDRPGDGLYAVNIRWTPTAAAELKERQYRYYSPGFEVEARPAYLPDEEDEDEDPEEMRLYVSRVINCALTNLPATDNQKPLMAAKETQQGEPMDLKAINQALGLKAEAKEADTLGEVVSLKSATADVCKLTGKPDAREALGVVAAWKEGHEKSIKLSEQVAQLQEDLDLKEREALIDAAVGAGKLAPKDEKARAFALSLKKDQLVAYLETLQAPSTSVQQLKQKEPANSAELDEAARKFAAKMGVTPEQLRAQKARG